MSKWGECTRQEFIDAVENGIRLAGDEMPVAERALLRHVGVTETRFLVGSFWDHLEECGCPLTMAGLTPTGNVPELPEYQRRFYGGFDRSFVRGGTIFEVTSA